MDCIEGMTKPSQDTYFCCKSTYIMHEYLKIYQSTQPFLEANYQKRLFEEIRED